MGPNGSGKSNVIDALLFVFGFKASKIRLKRVSELVHKSGKYVFMVAESSFHDALRPRGRAFTPEVCRMSAGFPTRAKCAPDRTMRDPAPYAPLIKAAWGLRKTQSPPMATLSRRGIAGGPCAPPG